MRSCLEPRDSVLFIEVSLFQGGGKCVGQMVSVMSLSHNKGKLMVVSFYFFT